MNINKFIKHAEWIVTESFHSHPPEPVDRLLLNEADALQDSGDVTDASLAGLQARGHLPDVQRAVRSRQHQLQETLRQLPHGHHWTQEDTQSYSRQCSNKNIRLQLCLHLCTKCFCHL